MAGEIAKVIARAVRAVQIDMSVGIQARDAQTSTEEGDITLVGVAAVNEFGSRDGRVRERSFLRSTGAEQGRAWLRELAHADLKYATSGDFQALTRNLRILGLRMRSQVVDKITDLRDPSNAPVTVAKKLGVTLQEARGMISDANPLIHTGQLRSSIRAAIEDHGQVEVVG